MAERKMTERKAIVIKYFRAETIDEAALAREMAEARALVKRRFPDFPVDVERVVAASTAYDRDVDLHFNSQCFFSAKLPALASEISKAKIPE